jgi:hypothetical protein
VDRPATEVVVAIGVCLRVEQQTCDLEALAVDRHGQRRFARALPGREFVEVEVQIHARPDERGHSFGIALGDRRLQLVALHE